MAVLIATLRGVVVRGEERIDARLHELNRLREVVVGDLQAFLQALRGLAFLLAVEAVHVFLSTGDGDVVVEYALSRDLLRRSQ
jgi:hypothetical protein